jgi:hypothetical protein
MDDTLEASGCIRPSASPVVEWSLAASFGILVRGHGFRLLSQLAE